MSGLGWYEFRTRAGVYLPFAVALGARRWSWPPGSSQVRVPGLAVFLLLSVAQAGVCIALLHAGLGRYLCTRDRSRSRWLVALQPPR